MRKPWLALAVLVVAGSVSASASPGQPKNRVLRTSQPVERLAADGARIAVATTTPKVNTCERIVVWNPAKRSLVWFKTGANCSTGSTVNEIAEIALANRRVAWLEAAGGNDVEYRLRTRALSAKRSTTVASATTIDGGDLPNTFIGNSLGDGNLLVYNSWTICLALPTGWEGGQSCPDLAPGDQPVYEYSNQRVLRIVNGKSVGSFSAPDFKTYTWGPSSLAIVAVNTGRIATQQRDDSVTIYSAAGDVLKQIAVPAGTFSGFALQGSQLATIRNSNLELYDVGTGGLVKTIPLAARSVLRDLQHGLAVYVRGRKVHVLRLSDEKNVTYSPPGSGTVDAQIEALGLFYSYNKSGRAPGRVAFVPFSALLKKLG